MFLPHLSSSPEAGIRFAAVVSFVLMLLKAILWWFSGSLAIIGSALDSFMDIFVSLANGAALSMSKWHRTRHFSYWFGKIQGFAALFEGGAVFAGGAWLLWNAFHAYQNPISIDFLEIWLMTLATLGSALIVWNFTQIQKTHPNSLLVTSDKLHYSSDILMNGGVLGSILATRFFGWTWVDAVSGGVIGIVIMYNSLAILRRWLGMLLDSSLSFEEIQHIDQIILSHRAVASYHNLRTRKSWDEVFLEAHLVFAEAWILLDKAHRISHQVEDTLRKAFPHITVTFHLDTHCDNAETLKE